MCSNGPPVSIGHCSKNGPKHVWKIVWFSSCFPAWAYWSLLVWLGASLAVSPSLCWLGCPGCLFVFSAGSFLSGGRHLQNCQFVRKPSDVCRCIEEAHCDKLKSISFVIRVTTNVEAQRSQLQYDPLAGKSQTSHQCSEPAGNTRLRWEVSPPQHELQR